MPKAETRKLTKTGSGSYFINIPKEIIKDLGWRERRRLKVVKKGGKVVVEI